MNPAQAILPGLEAFFLPPPPRKEWTPRPHILEKIKQYFRGYVAHDREIRARRKHQAKKIGLAFGTYVRYLGWLIKTGWMKTLKRCQRLAIREVVLCSESTDNQSTETTRETALPLRGKSFEEKPPEGASKPIEAAQTLPVGYDEQFRGYIGMFYAGGKSLNHVDIKRAYSVWGGMDLPERQRAVEHAYDTIRKTKFSCFIPFPVNHLTNQGWTRVGPSVRTIEYVDPKETQKQEAQKEASRRYDELFGGVA